MTANNDMPRIACSIYRAGYDDSVKFTPEQRQRMRKGERPYARDRQTGNYSYSNGEFV